jgi:hypothetical protein
MARAPKAKRPQNREVENEMIRPPEWEGEPPRSATEPPQPHKKRAASRLPSDAEK